MAKQKWDSRYSTGIERIDHDHRELLALIDRIHDMFVQGRYGKSDYLGVLESLSDYVAGHFAFEEKWMAEHNYPGLSEHRLDHERFSREVSKAVDSFKNGVGGLTLTLLTFLKVWLISHITVLDADLGRFDRERCGHASVIGF
ncbi:hypothetical protein GMST_28350 [Geomonas silvestris]|uniref:Hemerythrin-like domain-containing protein n=1 Tax=Geomonas silvestris TaxID=2740184 RepID=A0A6V8MKI4_9BACT|nr:bacteriohemerythrin [Geomonas silvestris]GFO60510.1 hypothetical protein GMST_28350 [Geomonas silvestris]